MEITSIPINNSKVTMVTANGYSSSPTISRGWNIRNLTEDFELIDSNKGVQIPFFIIPLSEGIITVGLADDPGEPYVISNIEVVASQGTPMLYLVKKIYFSGTTALSFNVGF